MPINSWLLIVCVFTAGCTCDTTSRSQAQPTGATSAPAIPSPFADDPFYHQALERYRAAEGPKARGPNFESLSIIIAKALRNGVNADLADVIEVLGPPDSIRIDRNVAALEYDYARKDGSDWTAAAFADTQGQITLLTLSQRGPPQ